MGENKKEKTMYRFYNLVFLLYFFPFLLVFLLVEIFFKTSFAKLLLFSLVSFSLLLVSYFILRKMIKEWFIEPFISVYLPVKEFLKTKSLIKPIEPKGPIEVREILSDFNRLMLELQAYRAFRIDKIVDENNKAKALADIVPDAAILADENNRVIYFNERAKILLNIRRDKEQRIPDCVGEEHFYKVLSEIFEAKKKSDFFELDLDMGDKGKKSYLLISKLFNISSLKKNGIAVVIRDITKDKEFEAAKDDFFHMITHDMRAPISTIEGYCSMIERKIQKTEEIEKYFQKVFYSSKKLKGMVEDTLNYRKLKEKKAILNLAINQACEIIEKVVDEHMPAASARNIKISVECEKNTAIFVDANLIERAISNLIGNAVKFTPSFGNIWLKFWQDDKYWFFSVKDDGPGITEDRKNMVFEKYISYDDNNNRGFGLGLALCKMVAEVHKGEISVKSNPGKGSEFFISISKNLSGDKNEKNTDN